MAFIVISHFQLREQPVPDGQLPLQAQNISAC